MARDTNQPDRLREMFAALDNDPYVVAECLARPLLAERLAREWYAFDSRFHGELSKEVRARLEAVPVEEGLRNLGGEYSEVVWRKSAAVGPGLVGQRPRWPASERLDQPTGTR